MECLEHYKSHYLYLAIKISFRVALDKKWLKNDVTTLF